MWTLPGNHTLSRKNTAELNDSIAINSFRKTNPHTLPNDSGTMCVETELIETGENHEQENYESKSSVKSKD